ncbi:MAG: hypothetical protein R6X05_03570 [Desulfobacterales bacterium]|jgi:hypothetical protein
MQTAIGPDNALALSRKWTLRAHGRQVGVVKKRRERATHVRITIGYADLNWRRLAAPF